MIEYRPLGNTGLTVSHLSFGGSALAGVYGPVETHDAIEAVRCAIDLGLNLMDTAPYYGDTLSESRIGEALNDGYRDKVILATKAGRYATGANGGFDYRYDSILRSWEASAGRLQTDFIDLFQLHDVEFVSAEEVIGEAWPAMTRLRGEGKVGHIGITGYPLQHLAHLASVLDPRPETVLSYCHYDLLNTSLDRWLIPTARDLGIGVINASVTHMGILTDDGAPDWHPAPTDVVDAGRRVQEHLRSRGIGITETALLFALTNPDVATTCVGMRTVDEVVANVTALNRTIDDGVLEEIEELVSDVKDLNWSQGYREYNDPGSVEPTR
ncbi:MAG: aldo/keto reductase [Acidimicrobiia bacterium]